MKKKIVKVLTPAETELLVKKLGTDKEAKRLDLVDLVEFMLGTGVRIGEACALRVPQVDIDGGTNPVAPGTASESFRFCARARMVPT